MVRDIIKKMYDKLGEDWVEVTEPEVLTEMLEENNINSSQEYIDLINAIKTCMVSDTPWTNVGVFKNVVDALTLNNVHVHTLTAPEIEDIMFAVHEMLSIKPEMGFSKDIARYISSVAVLDNYACLPQPLFFVNEFLPLEKLGIRDNLVKFCKNLESIDPDTSFKETPEDIQKAKLLSLYTIFQKKIEEE